MTSSSLQSQLNDVLNDLKTTYLDLVGGKIWAGAISSPTTYSFVASSTDNYEIDQAKAVAAKKKQPYDKWVKLYMKCHHYGEKGHIHPHCPKYIEQIKSGKIKLQAKHHPGPHGPPIACTPGQPAPWHDFMKVPKAKAFSLHSKPFSPRMKSMMMKATHATIIFKMHRSTMKQTTTYMVFFQWLVL
jgi:hypothetical protein